MANNLSELKELLEENFTNLPLVTKVTDIVHGEGDARAEVMFIGEAPGYHEHVQRRPFVGRSGQLLRKTLTEVGLSPEQVFISNIVKARPPDNRDPLPEEIEAFRPFLNREIELIDPQLIVTLGRFSMAKFLPDARVSQVHGRVHRVIWQEKPVYVLPMYHPAAALRSAQLKTTFVNDFEKIIPVLNWVKEEVTKQNQVKMVREALQ
ncbi:MAG TPA: uracil-DNA glycosylase [Candidatus Woesebacteria bacterium]|nr:uracil-DNA glycosylase [Candidatus Woesebacteria bacterium]